MTSAFRTYSCSVKDKAVNKLFKRAKSQNRVAVLAFTSTLRACVFVVGKWALKLTVTFQDNYCLGKNSYHHLKNHNRSNSVIYTKTKRKGRGGGLDPFEPFLRYIPFLVFI